MADRYTYIPLIGVFIALSWGLGDLLAGLKESRALATLAGAGMVAACALAAWVQVGYWQNSIVLWEHAIDAGADCDLVRVKLGTALALRGQTHQARDNFIAALHFKPDRADACHNLGLIAAKEGKLDEAISYYSQALRVDPDYTPAHANLAVALLQQEKFGEAGIHFAHVLKRERANQDARIKLKFALLGLGLKANPEEAVGYYQQLIVIQPNFGRTYYFLGAAVFEQGRKEASDAYFRRGLELDPDWPEEARQMAWALATHPDPRRRNGAMAVRIARQICAADKYRQPEILDVLAAALAETGNYDEAQRILRSAVELAEKTYSPHQLRPLKQRQLLYERHEPFRITPAGRAGGFME
jgi:protein O-mannosyl-transferase